VVPGRAGNPGTFAQLGIDVKPFRLAPPDPLETERLAGIASYLALEKRVRFFVRVNGGGRILKGGGFFWFYRLFFDGKEQKGKGLPDLIGMLRDGRFFAIEAKRPGEKKTPEQAEFLEMVRMTGGISGVAENWMQARKIITDQQCQSTSTKPSKDYAPGWEMP